MLVSELNQLSAQDFETTLMQCCTSTRWIERLSVLRPFASAKQLFERANECWQDLDQADYLAAFDGHPKIGDVSSLKAKYANTKALASGEQSGMNLATDEVIEALSKGNEAYFERFGFIFIVFATGKSAEQMLALLQARIDNSRDDELQIAAEQQRLIFQHRLANLIN